MYIGNEFHVRCNICFVLNLFVHRLTCQFPFGQLAQHRHNVGKEKRVWTRFLPTSSLTIDISCGNGLRLHLNNFLLFGQATKPAEEKSIIIFLLSGHEQELVNVALADLGDFCCYSGFVGLLVAVKFLFGWFFPFFFFCYCLIWTFIILYTLPHVALAVVSCKLGSPAVNYSVPSVAHRPCPVASSIVHGTGAAAEIRIPAETAICCLRTCFSGPAKLLVSRLFRFAVCFFGFS